MTETSWGIVHREMLDYALRGRIYTWAGEPLRKGADPRYERFSDDQRAAWLDLIAGGLIVRDNITELGYQAADTWGLDPDERLKGRIRS